MEQILGQEPAIQLLQATLGSGRLHHAYVFHGPAGVGKFTTAVAFAALLLCHDRQTDLAGRLVACGSCESCRLIAKPPAAPPAPARKSAKKAESDNETDETDEGPDILASAHPDLHIVTKELASFHQDKTIRERKQLTIPVEVLESALLEPVYRAAQLRHGKVFIVDEAELIPPVGQNKLLKTLEEPPAGTYLILVTSNQDKLLTTIRSRCLNVAFLPLPETVIDSELHRRFPDLSDKDRTWIVEFAAGSLGRALLAVDSGLTEWARTVLTALEEMFRGRYVVDLGARMAEHIDTLAKSWVEQRKRASKEAANRQAAGLMWNLIAQRARKRLTEVAALQQPPEVAEPALQPWLGVIEAVDLAERELAANVNLGLITDHLTANLFRALSRKTSSA